MGFLKWFLLAVLCVLAVDDGGLLLLSNGGVTSSFVRNEEKSIDMPFDSDVFRVPSGYNAPQQVIILMLNIF
ncbi:putative purple acid phosphatase [Helianthus annuus]|nr:putative purple acid phosphatase [Helianthus annuus]